MDSPQKGKPGRVSALHQGTDLGLTSDETFGCSVTKKRSFAPALNFTKSLTNCKPRIVSPVCAHRPGWILDQCELFR